MKIYPDKFFSFKVGERVFIDNRKNTTWIKHKAFINATHSEQPLYVIDRIVSESEIVSYTLSFFPVVTEHSYETNLAFVLNEIMCTKNKTTGKVNVSDYFSAFQRAENFILTNVPSDVIIQKY